MVDRVATRHSATFNGSAIGTEMVGRTLWRSLGLWRGRRRLTSWRLLQLLHLAHDTLAVKDSHDERIRCRPISAQLARVVAVHSLLLVLLCAMAGMLLLK